MLAFRTCSCQEKLTTLPRSARSTNIAANVMGHLGCLQFMAVRALRSK